METGSPIVTNVTLFQTEDAFTYINRGDPGTTLLAAVSDVTGRWGLGTPMFNASGSTNVDCPGLNSQGGNTADLDQQQAELNGQIAAANKKKSDTVVGVVVTLVLLLLIGGGVGFWYWHRRYKARYDAENAPEAQPAPFEPPPAEFTERGGNVLSINSFLDTASNSSAPRPSLSVRTAGSSSSSSSAYNSTNPFSSPHDSLATGSIPDTGRPTTSRPTSTGSSGRSNGFTSFPSSSIRRSAKAIEAGYSLDGDSGTSNRMLVRNGSAAPSVVSNASRLHVVDGADPTSPPGGEVVYQHQDGGTIVRELPPPYMARGNPGQEQAPAVSTDEPEPSV